MVYRITCILNIKKLTLNVVFHFSFKNRNKSIVLLRDVFHIDLVIGPRPAVLA